jgi:hypothetical protein
MSQRPRACGLLTRVTTVVFESADAAANGSSFEAMSDGTPSLAELRAEISHAAHTTDLAERALEIVAVVEALAAPMGVHPVVVGGLAVYFWTASDEFVTHDIEVVMEVPDELAKGLIELGFTRAPDGRHWTLEGTDVLLEAPSSRLDSDAEVSEIKLDSGRKAKVLSRVDILIDRLDEFQATGHETPALQALALLAGLSSGEIIALDHRASSRGVTNILTAIRQIANDLAAGRTPPDSGELHEISRNALQAEYPSRGP